MSVTGKRLTATVLKEVLTDGIVHRGLCVDVDTCRTMGVYDTNSKTQGLPHITNATDAILEVFIRQGYEYFQRITVWNGLLMAVRTGNKTSWREWRVISLTPVNT